MCSSNIEITGAQLPSGPKLMTDSQHSTLNTPCI